MQADFSTDENGENPADRRHSCCRERKRTGGLYWTPIVSPEHMKTGEMSGVFEERQKLHFTLFIPHFSSALPFHRLPSPWCLPLLDNVSASRVNISVWSCPLHLCLPPRPFPLHSSPHPLFYTLLLWSAPSSSLISPDLPLSPSISLCQNLEGG